MPTCSMAVGPCPKKTRSLGWSDSPRVVLLLRGAGEVDPGDVVGGLHELAAVEADAGGLAAPDVRGADLGESPVDGDGG